MPEPAVTARHSGRRGRRTGAMVRIAEARVHDLFRLADHEARAGDPALADRYVRLARAVGARYNVRLRPEHRELYCRSCSVYWIEGRTVRTRLRSGRRVRTCLRCGRGRRTRVRVPGSARASPDGLPPRRGPREQEVEVAILDTVDDLDSAEDESEPE